MRPWLVRGVVLAVLHAAADTMISVLRVQSPDALDTPRAIALGALVGVAALWAAVDGLLRRADRGRTWVLTAVLAAELGAVGGLIAKAVLLNQTSSADVWPAITGGAAFTALLVLVPAGLGLAVGGTMQSPRREVTLIEPDGPDTVGSLDDDSAEEPAPPSPRPRRGAHRRANIAPPG